MKFTDKLTKRELIELGKELTKELEALKKSKGTVSTSKVITKTIKVGLDDLTKVFVEESDKIKNELVVLINNIAIKEKEVKELKEKVINLHGEEITLGEAVDVYTSAVEELNNRLSSKRESFKDEKSNYIKEQEEYISELQEVITKLEKELEFTYNELDDKYKRLITIVNSDREYELNEKEDEYRVALRERQDKHKEELEVKYDELDNKLNTYKDTVNKAEDLKHNFNDKVRTKVNAIVQKIRNGNEATIKELTNELDSKIEIEQSKLDSVNITISSLDATIEKLQEEINATVQKTYNLRSKIADTNSASEARDIAKEIALEYARK